MNQITVASIAQGSEYDYLHFRALCQLEPLVSMLRLRNDVPAKNIERLRRFLEMLFADDTASARHSSHKRRVSGWARNQAELVKQDSNTLVLLGLCLTQTEISDYGERRLSVLLTVTRVLGSEACCQPIFGDATVKSICQGYKDKFRSSATATATATATAEPISFRQSSPTRPLPSNRMDINSMVVQHRIPPSSVPHSHRDLTLPPIVLPPPSALSLGSFGSLGSTAPISVPAFGLVHGPTPQGEQPDFQATPLGLEKVYIVTCSNQHLLPFLPKPPTIAAFSSAGRDEYKYTMSHDRYGKYELCLSKKGVQRLEATPLDGDRYMIAALTLKGALQTGKARSIVFRNVGCTVISDDVYIIWNNPRILLFFRECDMYQGLSLLNLMSNA